MIRLPRPFLEVPLAHRSLHDVTDGRPENSRVGIRAAIEAGYGIEIDVQLSADGEAIVFHDYALDRLTAESGALRQRSAQELGRIALRGGDEGIPDLAQVLELVAGRVPLLVEIKDQDGGMGPDVGLLESAVAQAVAGYEGPLALMSFNPHSVALMMELCQHLPCGITTSAYDPSDWPLPATTCARLREIPDFERLGVSFISHEASDLDRARVAELKDAGADILCWTIRSREAEARARRVAHNITFEGYLPDLHP